MAPNQQPTAFTLWVAWCPHIRNSGSTTLLPSRTSIRPIVASRHGHVVSIAALVLARPEAAAVPRGRQGAFPILNCWKRFELSIAGLGCVPGSSSLFIFHKRRIYCCFQSPPPTLTRSSFSIEICLLESFLSTRTSTVNQSIEYHVTSRSWLLLTLVAPIVTQTNPILCKELEMAKL